MAQKFQLEGRALTQFELVMPNRTTTVLDSGLVSYIGSTLNDSVYASAVYNHRLTTVTLDVVDRLLRQAMATPTPRLRFRLGVGNPDYAYWLPWQNHVIITYSTSPTSIGDTSGHLIHIVTGDEIYANNRASKVAARKGKISDIIRSIAAENSWKDLVIEPTVGEGVYTQTFESDVEFIRNRLVRRALNSKGFANYLFYFKDGVLHFHTPEYQAGVVRMPFYQMAGSALTQTDYSQKLFERGIAGVRMIAHDPYTGESREILSNPSKAIRYADSTYPTAGLSGAQLNIPYHLSTNPPEEAAALAQASYAETHFAGFQIKADIDKFIGVRAGDIVDFLLTPRLDSASPWSGNWLVSEVVHDVDQGSVTSRYSLIRGEIKKTRANVSVGAAGSQLVPEQEAPGQDLNLPEINTSERTKGAAKQTPGRVFTTLSDASKAPLG